MGKLFTIGITGGIGSGKTTVSEIFHEFGYEIIYADKIGHECLEKKKVIDLLVKDFGSEILDEGHINRKSLGKIVFSDSLKIIRLNEIMIPEMLEEIKKRIEYFSLKGEKILFVEAAILYEMKLDKLLDRVIYVNANEEIRLNRIKKRDNRSSEEIKKIMDKQIRDMKGRKTDYVMENNGSIDELQEACSRILKDLSRQISVKP